MASWTQESAGSTFNAESYAEKTISGRESSRSGSDAASSRSSYDVVGLNVAAVPNMREAIRSYVAAIESHLNGIDPLANASGAYRSEDVQNAVRTYLEKEKQYCINLVSQLQAFSDKLGDVKIAWETATGNIASSVSGATGNFEQGTKYTETVQ